jgi:hypothetical protein
MELSTAFWALVTAVASWARALVAADEPPVELEGDPEVPAGVGAAGVVLVGAVAAVRACCKVS